jgi:hypothetical protein
MRIVGCTGLGAAATGAGLAAGVAVAGDGFSVSVDAAAEEADVLSLTCSLFEWQPADSNAASVKTNSPHDVCIE